MEPSVGLGLKARYRELQGLCRKDPSLSEFLGMGGDKQVRSFRKRDAYVTSSSERRRYRLLRRVSDSVVRGVGSLSRRRNNVEATNKLIGSSPLGGMVGQLTGGSARLEPGMPAATKDALSLPSTGIGGDVSMVMSTTAGVAKPPERPRPRFHSESLIGYIPRAASPASAWYSATRVRPGSPFPIRLPVTLSRLPAVGIVRRCLLLFVAFGLLKSNRIRWSVYLCCG